LVARTCFCASCLVACWTWLSRPRCSQRSRAGSRFTMRADPCSCLRPSSFLLCLVSRFQVDQIFWWFF
jgi:hypothetical protein